MHAPPPPLSWNYSCIWYGHLSPGNCAHKLFGFNKLESIFDLIVRILFSNRSKSTSCWKNSHKSTPCLELFFWVSPFAVMDCNSWLMICHKTSFDFSWAASGHALLSLFMWNIDGNYVILVVRQSGSLMRTCYIACCSPF